MAEYVIPGAKPEDYGEYGSLTGYGITNFLNNQVRDITAPNRLTNKKYLENSINRLVALRDDAKERERNAYIHLGVTGLSELQKKVDDINQYGLINLSNAALRKMPLIRGMRVTGPTTKELTKIINEEFKEWLKSDHNKTGAKLNRVVGQIAEQQIEEAFEQFLLSKVRDGSGKRIRPSEKMIASTRVGEKTHRLTGIKLNAKMLRKYKHEIGMALGWEKNAEQIAVDIDVEVEDPTSYKFDFYPYFLWQDFSEEEQKELLHDEKLWEAFKKKIASCCPEYSEIIKQQMEIMEVGSFATAATSQKDVIGILGELQTMVILAVLCPNTNPRFLGHEKIDGKKVGVDVALESVGFQVKNYHMYGERDINQGINLGGDYTLNNFLDKLNNSFGDQQLEILRNYYAITAYHLKTTEKFGRIIRRYKTIDGKLDNLYHGAISEFLPLQEITLNIEEEGERKFQNAFYFIGGERIVPVSKIINLYIKFLKRLQEQITEIRIFTTKKHYKGQSYIDEHKAKEDGKPYVFVGYDTVAKNMRISYNINLNIDYTLKEMLSYMDEIDFYDF